MRLSVMFVRSAILALSLTVPVATVQAGPITSNVGDSWTSTLLGTSGTAVAITPHPLWEQTHIGTSGAVWISYADTGYFPNTTVAPFAQGNTDYVMRVRESITAMAGSVLTITVWADDTAIVRLVNENTGLGAVIIAHPTWEQSICETYAIGCRPWNSGSYSRTFDVNDAGNYQLWFDTYQIGTGTNNYSNPFGLMYEGSISEVPEPGSIMLFGTGLLGLAGALRRRIKK